MVPPTHKFFVVKTIQIVVDKALLREVDQLARKRGVSRSAWIRQSIESRLGQERLKELIERERAGYSRHPITKAEKEAFRALSAAQERVLARLGKDNPW